MKIYYLIFGVPTSTLLILNSKVIHHSYKMSIFKKLKLGYQFYFNTLRIPTATSFKSHLVIALKILEMPPTLSGCVIECGTWKGGSAVNLSLVCRIVDRELKIYDSFEGLPKGDRNDREAKHYKKGDYCGTLKEVKMNIKKYGAIECCKFVKGWFKDTLPKLNYPVLLVFIDVDLEASLDTCVRNIWPNLIDKGYIFIDEFVKLDYCALFFSEKYWKKYFRRIPPGLIGVGTGLPLGNYYVGPWSEKDNHPLHYPNAGAYIRKDMSGYWSYYPSATKNI